VTRISATAMITCSFVIGRCPLRRIVADSTDGQETGVPAAPDKPRPQRHADQSANHRQIEAPQPESGAGSRRNSRPFFFKRYRATPILLGFFVLMIACAFLLYPQRSSVYRPAPLTVNLSVQNGTPGGAFVGVSPSRSGFFTVSIGFGVNAPPPSALVLRNLAR
jgi:hypothetical protein